MKKFVSIFLVFIMMFSVVSISVYAEDDVMVVAESIEYLDDGYYIVTTLIEENDYSYSRATNTKTGSKTIEVYNDNNVILVQFKLTASFSYTGSSSTCTAASATYTIYNDQWKVPTATASKSGNVATGNFVAKHYVLFVVTQTVSRTFSIACSKTGVLS